MDRRSVLCLALAPAMSQVRKPDLLPSWNSGAAKSSIIDFVSRVTTVTGRDYVPTARRIAVFDNDGTLWTEQPLYAQFVFALDRVKALAPSHPEWKQQPAFQAAIRGDIKALMAGGEQALMKVMAASHAGMTTDEFEVTVRNWIRTARHPRFNRPYNELIYLPMLELVKFLKAREFKVYIVSGGGVEFMRAWAEEAYGIPPENVIGSRGKLKYEMRSSGPVLVKEAAVDFVDDRAGKPVSIQNFIGRRPIFAAGNSDGDLEMLQWTTTSPRPAFGLLVRHTDAQREFAYDRQSPIGRLDKALDEARQRNWLVVDMQKTWNTIYAAPPR